MQVIRLRLIVIISISGVLSGCGYQRGFPEPKEERPLVYVKREVGAIGNPIDSVTFNLGGDLYLRSVSSPSVEEINLTAKFTLGQGDVSDPEPAYDGNRLVFSMRCSRESSPVCLQDNTWNMWIYNHASGDITPVIEDFYLANLGDDVDPVFLPDGRIVFSSTRQEKTRDALGYKYLDEDRRSPVTALHVIQFEDMLNNVPRITQISFNQSHDRNPSIMHDGRILYTRWDHVGKRSKMSLYTINPDGTGLSILYGAHSPGESFLHAREISPGRVISTVMPLSGTWEGGALLDIDVGNFSDFETPTASGATKMGAVGHKQVTENMIPLGAEKSEFGRFSTPYAVTTPNQVGRILVSYSPFQPSKILDEETGQTVIREDIEGPPVYAIYLLDLDTQSLKPIVLPEEGYAFTDPVIMEPRAIPPEIPLQFVPNGLWTPDREEGIINVKSVYDTDSKERMGLKVLTKNERLVTPIPMLIFDNDQEAGQRQMIPDIAKIKDPLLTTENQRPARFVRITQAIPTPPQLSRQIIGETSFELQQIVGYAPVEPDGSVRVKVPANVPLAISVLDKAGRAYQLHTNWLQVGTGEELTCNGCHSPARGQSLNVAPVAGFHPNTKLRKASANPQVLQNTDSLTQPQPNETMAEFRTRLDPTALKLSVDIEYVDVWTSARSPFDSYAIRYQDLTTQAPTIDEKTGNIIINYEEHIQPLWNERDIQDRSGEAAKQCDDCHSGRWDAIDNPTRLDLSGAIDAAKWRKRSYETLMRGSVLYDETGIPIFETEGDSSTFRRSTPFIEPGHARGSYLIEKLFNQELHAEKGLLEQGLDHRDFMTAAEKRLVIEWIDLGGQYVNELPDSKALIDRPGLNFGIFFGQVVRAMGKSKCFRCHAPMRSNGSSNPDFVQTEYILTGNAESDFNATASMVTDYENPENSYLLSIPSKIEPYHPHDRWSGDLTKPLLPKDGDEYKIIFNWIAKARDDIAASLGDTP